MNTLELWLNNAGKTLLLALLALLLIVTTTISKAASADAPKGDKDKVVRQVVDNWIQIGTEEYKRGFYAAAEKAFLRAKDYEGYLTPAEREKIDSSLQQAHKAAVERENALAVMRTANELSDQMKFAEAKARLSTVEASEFLTEEERQLIKQRLDAIDKDAQLQKTQAGELYTSSVELFRAGQLPKAREGFVKVAATGLLTTPTGESPADYVAKIDKMLGEKGQLPPVAQPVLQTPAVQPLDSQPAIEKPKEQVRSAEVEVKEAAQPAPAAVPVTAEIKSVEGQPQQEQSGYIGVINRRINVIRGRTKAVVSDANEKANAFISQGQFDKAKEAVEQAQKVVDENHQPLGEYLFNQYSGQLNQLSERIAEGQKLQARQKVEEKQVKAEQAQREYKDKMSIEREKRITDLFQNALNFQKQQRYEEAIGQLDMLLAIDPQHNNALILKQTLEDMVNFRKQIEMDKQKGIERVRTFTDTEEATIPYAQEMTYPTTWREIIAKSTRQPEEAVGQDPANAVIEKQLDEIVDLSGLSAEMPLGEAIRLLENSVKPPITISVNWSDLYNNANIEKTTAINMDPLRGIRLRAALSALLRSVSGSVSMLDYIVSDGVVSVATRQSLPSRLETRVYDVTILVGRPADYYVSAASGGQGGGGQGGGGGGGGGGTGGGNMYFSEYFEETDEEENRDTVRQESQRRMESLVTLIQDTVAPTTWYDAGGEGTVTAYETKKLVVRQTPENHREIVKLLQEMRKALGHQIAIEARFLVVGENFLEELGMDVFGSIYLGEHFGTAPFQLNSFEMAEPVSTGLPGSFAISDNPVQFPEGYPADSPQFISQGALMGFFGGRFGGVLDHLQANFLIRATQAHRDTESLVAPKVTVLSGESATLQVRRTIRYALPPIISSSGYGGYGGTGGTGGGGGGIGGGTTVQGQYGEIPTGPTLNITPTITPDRKHVLLNIVAELWDFLGYDNSTVETPIPGGVGGQATAIYTYTVKLPQTERSRVKTRVSVPDGGTLLLGGLKRSASDEKEVGVPVLSKIPVLGRLFTNRSKVADQRVLLILVKPTIILQEEADAEAIAAMEGQL